jgi:hypothetical protein
MAHQLQNRKFRLLAAVAVALVVSACGGNPPPVPPPPSPNGAFFGGGGGANCPQAVGAVPLNPTGLPYSANMVERFRQGQGASISTTLYYQTALNGGSSMQNIVGTSNLVLPQLASAFPTGGQTQTQTYCGSTTDSTNGQSSPGRWSGGAIQILQRGLVPISFSPYGSFPGSYFQPGGGSGFGASTDSLEIRIGYSCDAWVSNNRLNGCVDVSLRYLGVNLQLYAQ